MKTLIPVEWANQTFYTAGAGDWRTGANPTKEVPPVSFAAEGLVPGDRFAAQWENYYRNTNTGNIKDLAKEQLANYVRSPGAPASFGSDSAIGMAWNPYQKSWIRISYGTAGTRVALFDGQGNLLLRGDPTVATSMPTAPQNRAVFVDTGTLTTSFSVHVSAGNNLNTAGVSVVAAALHNDASGFPVTARPTGPGVYACHEYGNGLSAGGFALFPGYLIATGAPCILRCSLTTWTVVTLPSAPSVKPERMWVSPGAGGTSTLWCFAMNTTANTSYIWKSTNSGASWSLIFSGVNIFIGHLNSAPIWDAGGFWYLITDQSTAFVSTSTTRMQTRVYKATDAGLAAGVLSYSKTISGLSVFQAADLGSGRFVAMSGRFGAQASAGSDRLILGVAVSTDYGDTWNLVGQDFPVGTATTIVGTAKPDLVAVADSQWFIAPNLSAVLGYANSVPQTHFLFLCPVGGNLTTYT